MSWKVRAALVLVIGTVLGLTVSVGATLLGAHARPPVRTVAAPEYLDELVAVMERVRREYVDVIDDEQLVDSAIRGVLEELDQHSRFLNSSEYEDIRVATTGAYTGIGLDLKLREGRITVVEPVAGAPAERAGIRAGDVVVSVDEVPVDEADIEATVSRMRGAPGTSVTLGVERAGESGPMRFALERTAIRLQTVRGADLGDGYAYLRVSGFTEATPADLEEAAVALRATAGQELRGLVLDLRDNPGGVLESAIGVADLFIDDGLIVRGTGRTQHARFAQYARPGDTLERVPLAVLVNGGSASASEIVAGAIKDHDRGKLVGERTFGKGSVQSVLPLGDGNAIKLTTSRYLTPSGRSINGRGIDPDYPVQGTNADGRYSGTGGSTAAAGDPQIQRALQLLGYRPIAISQAP